MINIISSQLFLTLVSAVFITAITGYLGTLMLSKKMSIVADPLSHLTLPGAALAIIYGYSLFLGVFPFVIFGIILIWLIERKTKLPMENVAAIVFAIAVSSALLILPIDKAEEILIGNITKITVPETLITIILSLIVFYIVRKIYLKMMLINIHEDLAIIEGVNINLCNFLYLLSIAIVLGLGVYLVGGFITAALVAIPAASAKNLSRNLFSYKILSIFFGIISAIVGIFFARFIHLPTGPMVIAASVFLFFISIIFQRKTA